MRASIATGLLTLSLLSGASVTACGGSSSGDSQSSAPSSAEAGSLDASADAPAPTPSEAEVLDTSVPDAPVEEAAPVGCPTGYAEAGTRCCPEYPGERTVWCDPFDTLDPTFWGPAPGYDSSYSVQNGALVLERSTSGVTGLESLHAYGYGIYRYRFRVESGDLEAQTGWAIWQWQNTGSAPSGKFNEIDAMEIYGDGWDPSLPAGGSAGSAYLNNLWIQCPMVSNPPASCVRGQAVHPAAPINGGQWHDLEVRYQKSDYELLVDGQSLRSIHDANLPLPPMAIYFAVNVRSATHALVVDIDDCSYSVELSD